MPFNCELQLGRAVMAFSGSARIMELARVLAGILFCALIYNPVPAFSQPLPETYGLTLEWNPSPSPAIVGCHLYYGTVSGEYTNTVVVGNVTTVTVSGLLAGVTYYFAITAVDADGQESDFSNEISYRQEPSVAQLQIHSETDGQLTLTATGPAGHTYDIEATEDFVTWTVIGTETIDDSDSLEFTDIDAPNYSQRFYRLRDTQPVEPAEPTEPTEPSEPEPELPGAQMQIQGVVDGQITLTVTGPAGHTYDIEATEDFVTWTVIGTATLDDSGSLEFTDTDAPNYSQRFYRMRDLQF